MGEKINYPDLHVMHLEKHIRERNALEAVKREMQLYRSKMEYEEAWNQVEKLKAQLEEPQKEVESLLDALRDTAGDQPEAPVKVGWGRIKGAFDYLRAVVLKDCKCSKAVLFFETQLNGLYLLLKDDAKLKGEADHE